jgi:hypothetical protein
MIGGARWVGEQGDWWSEVGGGAISVRSDRGGKRPPQSPGFFVFESLTEWSSDLIERLSNQWTWVMRSNLVVKESEKVELWQNSLSLWIAEEALWIYSGFAATTSQSRKSVPSLSLLCGGLNLSRSSHLVESHFVKIMPEYEHHHLTRFGSTTSKFPASWITNLFAPLDQSRIQRILAALLCIVIYPVIPAIRR